MKQTRPVTVTSLQECIRTLNVAGLADSLTVKQAKMELLRKLHEQEEIERRLEANEGVRTRK